MGWLCVWTVIVSLISVGVGGATPSNREGILEITVIDRFDGKPIEAADMNVRRIPGDQWWQARSDKTGVARLRLTPGQYKIERVFKFNHYATTQPEGFVWVTGDKTCRVAVKLAPQPKCSGVVLDPAGKPVHDAVVRILPTGVGEEATGPAGTFKVAWDPIDFPPPFYLVIRCSGRNLAAIAEIPRTTQDFTLKLAPATTVTGHVVDSAGKAVPGAIVHLVLCTPYHESPLSDRAMITSMNGEFAICTVPAWQRYILVASAEKFGRRRIPFNVLETPAGKIDLGRIALTSANLTLSGVVLGLDGKPVSGIPVSLFSESQSALRVRTDFRGQFRFSGICDGPVRLQADARERGGWGTADIHAMSKNVTIRLKALSTQPSK